jgi:hypothetical protein
MDAHAAPRYDLSVDGGAGYHRDELAELATTDAAERAGDMADTLIPVPFESLLVDNDVPDGSTHVTFEASDGYAVSVPIAQAQSNAILLVPRHDDPRYGVRLLLFGSGKACMNVKAVVKVSFSEGHGRHTVDPDPHRNREVPGWDQPN